jgi:hypothetical protein
MLLIQVKGAAKNEQEKSAEEVQGLCKQMLKHCFYVNMAPFSVALDEFLNFEDTAS